MVPNKPSPTAGEKLKELRVRLGLTTRDVEARSQQIADERHNREYYISHAWVTDIENNKFTPTIYKLYSLSAIFHVGYTEVLSYFGLPIGDLARYRTSIGVPKTHLLSDGPDLEIQKVSLPIRLKPDFQLEKTNLLARVVEKWDQIPVGFLQHLDLHKSVYGYIGIEDYTLYPLIRPGSLVQIDASQRKISSERWKTEFDRPIYFVELRNGYVCSWCQVDRGQLIVIPHPHSDRDVRRFDYPSEAEIVGRVTGVAMRIVSEKVPDAGEHLSGGSR
jgi:transcriptional regulator with XRE-family HTH domain